MHKNCPTACHCSIQETVREVSTKESKGTQSSVAVTRKFYFEVTFYSILMK